MTDDIETVAVGDVVVLTRPSTDRVGNVYGPGAKGHVTGTVFSKRDEWRWEVMMHSPDGHDIAPILVPTGWLRKIA